MSNRTRRIPDAATGTLFLFATCIILPVVLFGHLSALLAR